MAKRNKTKGKATGGAHKIPNYYNNNTRGSPPGIRINGKPLPGHDAQNLIIRTTETFTLADEARQTGQHDHSIWSQETKLRSMPIPFVSAGPTEPLNAEESCEEAADRERRHLSDTNDYEGEEVPEERKVVEGAVACKETPHKTTNHENATQTKQAPEASSLFYYDTGRYATGRDQTENAPQSQVAPNTTGPEPEKSDNDGEVILFRGRLRANRERDIISMANIHSEICAVEKEIEPSSDNTDSEGLPVKVVPHKKPRGKRGGRREKAKHAASGEEDDSMFADYIANMRENGEMDSIFGTLGVDEDIDSGDESTDESDAEELPADAIPTVQPATGGPGWNTDVGIITGFDPMDWERPSLRRNKSKGAKQQLDLRFADIDSETERRLQATWKSDRLRKAERKREREQLRTLNLLGKKKETDAKEDMRTKYPKGISLEQIACELKNFLISTDNRYESIGSEPSMQHELRKTG